jgi:hypothetical protein
MPRIIIVDPQFSERLVVYASAKNLYPAPRLSSLRDDHIHGEHHQIEHHDAGRSAPRHRCPYGSLLTAMHFKWSR